MPVLLRDVALYATVSAVLRVALSGTDDTHTNTDSDTNGPGVLYSAFVSAWGSVLLRR